MIREGDAVRRLRPLMRRRSQFGWRLLEFAGTGNADYQDFILPRRQAAPARRRLRFLRTAPLELGAPRALATSRAIPRPLRSSSRRRQHRSVAGRRSERAVPDAAAHAGSGARATHDRKYSLRRPLNWFRKHGEVNFRHVTSRDEIERCCPSSSISTGAAGRTSANPASSAMHARRAFTNCSLAACTRTAGCSSRSWSSTASRSRSISGSTTAVASSGTSRRSTCASRSHSPGLLLTRLLIEDGLRRSRRELDFTIGDEAFKERFSSHQR